MPREFRMTRRVEFHETDLAGIAHFSNFFKWMEAVEHAYFRSLGLSIASTEPTDGQKIGWPRVHASCDYRAPVRFEQEMEIRLQVAALKSRSIVYDIEFAAISDPTRIIASGQLIAACVTTDPTTHQMKATAIPPSIVALIES